MDEITGPLLSVRGHARLTVDPDYAALGAVLSSVRGSKEPVRKLVGGEADGCLTSP
jgi:hypothetical protein